MRVAVFQPLWGLRLRSSSDYRREPCAIAAAVGLVRLDRPQIPRSKPRIHGAKHKVAAGILTHRSTVETNRAGMARLPGRAAPDSGSSAATAITQGVEQLLSMLGVRRTETAEELPPLLVSVLFVLGVCL